MIRVQKLKFDLEGFKALALDFDTKSPFLAFRQNARSHTKFYDKVFVDAWDVIGSEEWIVRQFIHKGELTMSNREVLAATELIAVESSNLAEVGYNGEQKMLFVKFTSGAIYGYTEVEREVFDQLLSADSKGKFFIANVKNSFNYERVA